METVLITIIAIAVAIVLGIAVLWIAMALQ